MITRLAKLPLRAVRKVLEAVRDGGRSQPAPTPAQPRVTPEEAPEPPSSASETRRSLQVRVETTPNPNATKFVADATLVLQGSRSWSSADEASGDPLGEALFQIAGVASVFMVNDFVTVTKNADATWEQLTDTVTEAIETHAKPA